MKYFKAGLLVLNLFMLCSLFLLLDAQGASLIVKGDWEYKDLVAILLSVVSVMVTFVGIIIAVAAIWGFQTLKSMAEEKAIETSKLGSNAYLQSDEFKGSLDSAIQKAIESAAKDAVQDALAPLIVTADDGADHQAAGDQEWED